MAYRKRPILLHVTGCLIFLSLPVLLSPNVYTTLSLFNIPPFQRDFFGYFLVLIFFYLNYYYFLPKLYFQKKYLVFVAAIACCYLVIATLPQLLIRVSLPNAHGHGPSVLHIFAHHFFQFLAVIIFSLLLQTNRRLRQAEKEKMKAELSYLRAQINPHFLFNTLNSIYSLAIQKSDKTPKAIVDLSNLMRYVTTEAHQEFVPLDNEIIYITNYINLQIIRLGDTVPIDFRLTGKMDTEKIAPLILIPFVENAFKYGVNPEQSTFIRVVIEVAEGKLSMNVSNMKTNIPQDSRVEKSGQGIENTRHRLQALYPGKHQLLITDAPTEYTVDLKIDLR